MLRISFDGTQSEPRWTLCGQLSGPWVAEFLSVWKQFRSRSDSTSYVIDLSDVTSVDEQGEMLLRTMKEDGASFIARGIDMHHILAHLLSNGRPSLRRSLAHLDRDGQRS